MITLKFIVLLSIGTFMMLIPMLIQTKWYRLSYWKTIIISVLLTLSGTLGTYIWYSIETGGGSGGRSFYGAVFIVPLLFIPIAYLFRIPYAKLMDLCAPAECMMLVLMKVLCLMEGCCGGRVLFVTSLGAEVRFPSQLAELINAFILCVVLLVLSYKKERRGTIYPWYLLLYGVTRFVLNFFRDVWTDTWMPMGTLWSICAFCIGLGLLLWNKRRKINIEKQEVNT